MERFAFTSPFLMQLLRALGLGASSRRGRRRARARSADVTARRALEALAAPDASAALVFALVHDAEFRLAQAVASVGLALL